MPVSRMASRSARGVPDLLSTSRFGKTPGNRPGSSRATSGFATNLANRLSPSGGWVFQKSLRPMGTMTSLNSGMASRETCRYGPVLQVLFRSVSSIRTRWRLAVVHTPIVARGSVTSLPLQPPRVRSVIGTCSAMVCTLRFFVALTPLPDCGNLASPKCSCASANGRGSSRSKIAPRST